MTTRREVLFALGALALLPACGGDDDGAPTPGTDAGRDTGTPPADLGSGGSCTAVTSRIDANHGHALTVPPGDIAAGTAQTYGIMGSSGHTHSVTLSASNFAALQSDGMVVVMSTTGNGHMHAITVTCA